MNFEKTTFFYGKIHENLKKQQNSRRKKTKIFLKILQKIFGKVKDIEGEDCIIQNVRLGLIVEVQ